LHDGRFDVSNMMPGEVRKVAFTFDVEPQLADPEAKIELSIHDQDLREGALEKIRIPIVDPIAIAPASGAYRAKASGADLFSAPEPSGRLFARLPPGAAAPALGTADGYVKLSLGDGRFAFARASDLAGGAGAPAQVAFQDAMEHAAPSLDIPQPQLATRETHTPVHVIAGDDTRLLDAYIFVGARKVFYRSNRNGVDPRKMTFDADLPLRPGVNVVMIVARENPDTTSRRTFIVRRDGASGELLATPKTDDELSETAASDEE
jgi:carboxyl-terminal processing protease